MDEHYLQVSLSSAVFPRHKRNIISVDTYQNQPVPHQPAIKFVDHSMTHDPQLTHLLFREKKRHHQNKGVNF